MSKYRLDYFSKYYFYEEEEFAKEVEDGEYILNQMKESNRFDYKGHSYKYTKFGNISKSDTQRDVEIETIENDINVLINGEKVHLDLIYKFDVSELEDHVRIATRISEKIDDISCLLYIDYSQAKDFISDLKKVEEAQVNFMNS